MLIQTDIDDVIVKSLEASAIGVYHVSNNKNEKILLCTYNEILRKICN